MNTVNFKNHGTMTLENVVRSIFDIHQGCWISTDKQYLYIFMDAYNGDLYALTETAYWFSKQLGHTLQKGESAVFCGCAVRCMTVEEEYSWNEGTLPESKVDLWGNVKVEEEISESYDNKLTEYYEFAHKFSEYVLYNVNATIDEFRFWKNLQAWVNASEVDVSEDNKVCFITWLQENWGYWLKNILSTGEPVLNITDTIWKSWENF